MSEIVKTRGQIERGIVEKTSGPSGVVMKVVGDPVIN